MVDLRVSPRLKLVFLTIPAIFPKVGGFFDSLESLKGLDSDVGRLIEVSGFPFREMAEDLRSIVDELRPRKKSSTVTISPGSSRSSWLGLPFGVGGNES